MASFHSRLRNDSLRCKQAVTLIPEFLRYLFASERLLLSFKGSFLPQCRDRFPLLLGRIHSFQNRRHFHCVWPFILKLDVIWVWCWIVRRTWSVSESLLLFIALDETRSHNLSDLAIIVQNTQSRQFISVLQEKFVVIYFILEFVTKSVQTCGRRPIRYTCLVRVISVILDERAFEFPRDEPWFTVITLLRRLETRAFERFLRQDVVTTLPCYLIAGTCEWRRRKDLFGENFAEWLPPSISEEDSRANLVIYGRVVNQLWRLGVFLNWWLVCIRVFDWFIGFLRVDLIVRFMLTLDDQKWGP